MPESFDRGALTEAVFYILLTLINPTHGYGIMKHVNEVSNGRVVLGSGTLYGAINTLLQKGWIEMSNNDSKNKKKEYIITTEGEMILRRELHRIKELYDTGAAVLGGLE